MLAMLLAATLAAPVPKVKDQLYFPTKEGATRVLTTTIGDRTTESTETVAKSEEKDGTYSLKMERDTAGRKASYVLRVSVKGVFRMAGDEPQALFQPEEGIKWEIGLRLGETMSTTGKAEDVIVPAGKFRAVPVVSVTYQDGEVTKSTAWYAPGVGMVRSESDGGNSGQKRVVELKEFTPGK